MPVYDCGDPECLQCQAAFGPDRSVAIAAYERRCAEMARAPELSRYRGRADQIEGLLHNARVRLEMMIQAPVKDGVQDAVRVLSDVREAIGILRAASEPLS